VTPVGAQVTTTPVAAAQASLGIQSLAGSAVFGVVTIGTKVVLPVTVTSPTAVMVRSIVLDPSSSSSFFVVDNGTCLDPGESVQIGDGVSCVIHVGFLPTQLGYLTGTINVNLNGGTDASPLEVALNGEGAEGFYAISGDGEADSSLLQSGADPTAYTGLYSTYGSLGSLNAFVVGAATTPDGRGLWEVASDGGVFARGDASFFGSMGSVRLNRPIVGMASTPDGGGYWLVASDGGIFSFGDAKFFGSTGSIRLNRPIVGMASTPDGGGYWLVASDGGIFTFGDAPYLGSMAADPPPTPAVGIALTPTGDGYWIFAGAIVGLSLPTTGNFGDAPPVTFFSYRSGVAITPVA
jgi:hypothetical protein